MLLACKILLPNTPIVSSYHTNIALYAKMFGFGFLFEPIWATHRLYHGSSQSILCPSYSTKEELVNNGFDPSIVHVWSRGVDSSLFTPLRRNPELRDDWTLNLSRSVSEDIKQPLNSYNSLNSTPRRRSDIDEGVHFGLTTKTVLLYVGRISWEKNLRLLVSAFQGMNHEQYHLVVVGDGPARSTIAAELAEANAEVTFTGYLKGEKLAEAYASADLFVFPSRSETFGQVVLEAQASGLPVVAMRAEGVKEIVDHKTSGLLVDPVEREGEDADWEGLEVAMRFRKAIESISENSSLLEKMSKGAVDRSKKFTWNAAMQSCMDAYQRAVQ